MKHLLFTAFFCLCGSLATLADNHTTPHVYTAQNGKKYHTHKECQYIKGKDDVKTISKTQAEKDGKTICSRCKAKDNKAKEGGKK